MSMNVKPPPDSTCLLLEVPVEVELFLLVEEKLKRYSLFIARIQKLVRAYHDCKSTHLPTTPIIDLVQKATFGQTFQIRGSCQSMNKRAA